MIVNNMAVMTRATAIASAPSKPEETRHITGHVHAVGGEAGERIEQVLVAHVPTVHRPVQVLGDKLGDFGLGHGDQALDARLCVVSALVDVLHRSELCEREETKIRATG